MSGAQPTQNTTFLFSGNPTFLFGTYTSPFDNFYYVKYGQDMSTWNPGKQHENHGDPLLAVGDGAMGLWAALDEVFPQVRHQRCWFH